MSTQRYVVRYKLDRFDRGIGGAFVKLGGGATTDLQQANVVGWTKDGLRRWTDYPQDYELVPVRIVDETA